MPKSIEFVGKVTANLSDDKNELTFTHGVLTEAAQPDIPLPTVERLINLKSATMIGILVPSEWRQRQSCLRLPLYPLANFCQRVLTLRI